MSYQLRVSQAAQEDLERLFDFLAANNVDAALQARDAIEKAYEFVEFMPFACRKVNGLSPFFREVVIPFGSAGYVALFEIEDNKTITILAVRHQREADYY